MLTLTPFDSFSHDAEILTTLGEDSPLPMRWLAAAQVAARLADSRPKERAALLRTWLQHQAADEAEAGVWSALVVPGISVRDVPSAVTALCAIGAEMERAGALHMAYATVTNSRIAVLNGPVVSRGYAAVQQARILRQLGYHEEAGETYAMAREDAAMAGDQELEARGILGEAALAGQKGNYPLVVELATRALEILPEESEYVADAHITLMASTSSMGQFATAFEHGWRGYDAAAQDTERRASVVSNLSTLALRTGRFTAARRGFIATLSLTQAERIVLPTLSGLSLTNAATRDHAELAVVAERIELRSATSVQPYEVARAMFELAEAWKEAGELEKAQECLARARQLALRHGFHEVTFRSELLAEALAAAAATTPVEHGDRIKVSIARFSELAADEHVLATI